MLDGDQFKNEPDPAMLLPPSVDRFVTKALRALGYTLSRNRVSLPSSLNRRQRLLMSHRIDLVVDVGANRIKLIQIELSFRPLYQGQAALVDTVSTLENLGFNLVGIEPGFADHSTGELLQADGIFLRNNCRAD